MLLLGSYYQFISVTPKGSHLKAATIVSVKHFVSKNIRICQTRSFLVQILQIGTKLTELD